MFYLLVAARLHDTLRDKVMQVPGIRINKPKSLYEGLHLNTIIGIIQGVKTAAPRGCVRHNPQHVAAK
jgi:hypothetical protein